MFIIKHCKNELLDKDVTQSKHAQTIIQNDFSFYNYTLQT